ncbi:MAG: aldehyde dehydrogenase family protein [Acidobacteria bacterium]|nr:aldehyde dehydrogenase family protein [Acidobacteriota bacterium]
MIHLPILRWGQPYRSLDVDTVVHFDTGETIAEFSQTTGMIIRRDMRHAQRARDVLREIPPKQLVAMCAAAADIFMKDELPIGDDGQTPEQFVHCQSATTGLPEQMCRTNMGKLAFVLSHMGEILDSLTRGLDLEILSKGYGYDSAGRLLSYQAQTDVLGCVLPSNSPGVHSLWLPVIPMQIGLVLKPGAQEPWTPYRMAQALFKAGVPKQAISVYPSGPDAGPAVMGACSRTMIFGGQPTVDKYAGNPGVQVHGPGWSKIILGEDAADDWEQYLDVMEQSVLLNSGRSCINCSSIWTPRHGREIAQALAERLAKVQPLPPEHPDAPLAAFTVAGVGEAISELIDNELDQSGAEDLTQAIRGGSRAVTRERCSYLLPTVVYAGGPDSPIVSKEFMFPFVNVVECPQEEMLGKVGYTLVATAITEDESFRRKLMDSIDIDRLNFGPVPTTKLDWLQPHEGNIVEWLYRARSFQSAA